MNHPPIPVWLPAFDNAGVAVKGGVRLRGCDDGGVPFLEHLPGFDGRSGLVSCALASVLVVLGVGSVPVGDAFFDPFGSLLKHD